MSSRIDFAIVGGAWRAEFFLRVAQACPDRFRVTGVVTGNAQRAAMVRERFGVTPYASVKELLDAPHPLFAVTSVPRTVNAEVIRQLTAAGLPVLSETPPADTVERMVGLCQLVARGAKIQVAEQLHLQPAHAARIALARGGKLGAISHVQVSITHGYHCMSLMRRFLGIGYEDATIAGCSFTSKIVEGPGRNGPPPEQRIVDSSQSLVTFDFVGRTGVMDFTGDQYFSPIRGQRLLVRGERGEIVNYEAVYLRDHLTPIRLAFRREEAGPNGNFEGQYLKGILCGEDWIYRNPLAPGRLSDDEIAIGDCLLKMARCVQNGEDFYSLAEACQDTYLDLMAQQAVQSGQSVRTTQQAWARMG